MTTPQLWRYADLVSAGIVRNRTTLYRWIQQQGFPSGILIGPNTRVWPREDVLAWLTDRRQA